MVLWGKYYLFQWKCAPCLLCLRESVSIVCCVSRKVYPLFVVFKGNISIVCCVSGKVYPLFVVSQRKYIHCLLCIMENMPIVCCSFQRKCAHCLLCPRETILCCVTRKVYPLFVVFQGKCIHCLLFLKESVSVVCLFVSRRMCLLFVVLRQICQVLFHGKLWPMLFVARKVCPLYLFVPRKIAPIAFVCSRKRVSIVFCSSQWKYSYSGCSLMLKNWKCFGIWKVLVKALQMYWISSRVWQKIISIFPGVVKDCLSQGKCCLSEEKGLSHGKCVHHLLFVEIWNLYFIDNWEAVKGVYLSGRVHADQGRGLRFLSQPRWFSTKYLISTHNIYKRVGWVVHFSLPLSLMTSLEKQVALLGTIYSVGKTKNVSLSTRSIIIMAP